MIETKKSVLIAFAFLATSSPTAIAQDAQQILNASSVQGGLAVVIGCDRPTLLAELRASDAYFVHGLDRDPDKVAASRSYLREKGLYGSVTAAPWDGPQLPFADNLVNLLVLRDAESEIPEAEMDRVLAPRGVLVSKFASNTSSLEFHQMGDWFVYRKPVPDTIDDWPMHMYEPGNNAVSRDRLVGPPKRLQWRSGPTWTRSHEFASSLNAMVSMKGKLFYVMDEGSRLSPVLPEKWTLVCRDAFNGIVLWKRPLPSWHTHWWPVKSGPTQAMRRLVALDDKLYIPLGAGAPLSELDAATGETVRIFEGTDGVEEIRASEGTIFLLTSDAVAEQQKFNLTNVEVWGAAGDATGQFKWDDRQRMISAIDRESGERQWRLEYPVMTLTLAIDGKRLYFHNGREVVAIDRETSTQVWTSENLELKQYKLGTATAPSLLVHNDVVICGQGFDFDEGAMLALSAETGKTLWKEVHQSSGHSSPDGWLYCLDATDGRLAWRFRAAPEERMLISDGRVESAWPVHGSVLIENDTIYCLAGRPLFLDGGMYLSLLDPSTGELIATHEWDDIDKETGKSMQLSNEGLKMVPSNSDLLVSDGRHIYLKAQKIGLDGRRIFPERGGQNIRYTLSKSDQDGEGTHLFSPPGFLDTAWHHRSYWLYGRAAGSGWGGWMKPGKYVPAGRILVVDADKNVFGFGREPAFFAQSHALEYQLFSARSNTYWADDWKKVFAHMKSKEASITNWQQNRELPIEKLSAVQYNWRTANPPLLVRAMVGAGDILFLAGPPDILDETRLHGRFLQPAVVEQIQQQQDAVDGKLGGMMWAVSAKDGTKLSEQKLNSLPVFDGLIAANETLLMSTTDGRVICYSSP